MSAPVRVPDDIHQELQGASRLMGCTPGELLAQAWESFRQSPSFRHDLERAQKAFMAGDLSFLASQYRERRHGRARAKAVAVQELRGK